MDLNFIVFPAPKCSYSEDIINGQLIWIPKHENKNNYSFKRTQTTPITSSSTSTSHKDTASFNENQEEDTFSATRNKNFGSHAKPIQYKKKQNRYIPQQEKPSQNYYYSNFEDTLYYENSASQRLFYSVSYQSQRNLKAYSSQPTQLNIDQNIQPASFHNISGKIIQNIENLKKDKDYISIMQENQNFNNNNNNLKTHNINHINDISNKDKNFKQSQQKQSKQPQKKQQQNINQEYEYNNNNNEDNEVEIEQGMKKNELKNNLYEESNKSCHGLDLFQQSEKENKRGSDYEEECIMERDCNEYDEMHSHVSSNIKPDSITQYTFYKPLQSQSTQQSNNTKKQDNNINKSQQLNNNKANFDQNSSTSLNSTQSMSNKDKFKKAQTMGNTAVNFNNNENHAMKQKNANNYQQQQQSQNNQYRSRDYLPCLYLNSGNHSPNYLLYFHGNGEDINLSYDLLSHIKNNLEINVIAMEYPGYGIYEDYDREIDKSDLILRDAEYLYDYLTQVLHIDEKRIIIFGRSIGSGPATHIAAQRNPGALILMSAFTSLRQVASDLVGRFFALALKDRFNNLENIQHATCPTFLVHGQIDKLISYNHSMTLFQNCGGICQINLPKEMTHVEFDFYEDFSKPLIEFLLNNRFNLYNYSPRYDFNLPYFLFQNPDQKRRDHSFNNLNQRQSNQFQTQKIYIESLRPSVD